MEWPSEMGEQEEHEGEVPSVEELGELEVVPLTLVKEGEEWEVWLPSEAEE